ncbi:MAG: aminotransferase class I/II-fold pyridoxal phosphate-dependent enzyme [Deltaproteobacteria bacterium]|nr:aminotransferase class I/II-fold pyridoxal phosphate-dependent enzyme [Deltaproteobacteria bacterium]
MPFDRLEQALRAELDELDELGTRKRDEPVIVQVLPPEGKRGPRVLLQGEDQRPFLRMNCNGYLGLASHPEVIAAEESAAQRYGAGPGSVRFISGTFFPHVRLEQRLATFHSREAAMIFSSAYAAVMGVLPPLVGEDTAVISDELNHNCIISAMRMAQPARKYVYPHLDMRGLAVALESAVGDGCRRVIVVTDGVFSMRGDHALLNEIVELARRFDHHFDENVVVMADDSHGIGAFGQTGRGTEEVTGAQVDVLVATLGKALGVNGGYVVGSQLLIDFLREKSAFYIYSNPTTPAEAAAATKSIDILDSDEGRADLAHLRGLTRRFEEGLRSLGLETIAGEHPIVPLLVRDSKRTRKIVERMREAGVIATGLAYPVVPRGEEEIRFQLSAEHTLADVDEVLDILADATGG